MKKVIPAAIVTSIVSIVVLVYNFFKMYGLVAKCPNGSAGCSAYSDWHVLNIVGIGLFALSIALFILGSSKKVK